MSLETRARQDVTAWRMRQLRRAGFAVADAARAARDERYDLHALVELVGRGCTPALALRILAPLDEEAT
jgi:hypothetical protein